MLLNMAANLLLAQTLIAHVLVIALDLSSPSKLIVEFPSDLQILAFFSLSCSIFAFFTKHRIRFRAALAVRAVALFALACASSRAAVPTASLLLYVFIIETTAYLRTRPAVAVGLAMTLAWITGTLIYPPPDGIEIRYIASLSFLAISTIILGARLTWYREGLVDAREQLHAQDEAIAKLTAANRDYQHYASDAEGKSAENERNRITRELHDTIGYALTNLIMMMNAGKLLARKNPEAAEEVFENGKQQADGALREVRRILYKIRELEDSRPRGMAAIAKLCNVFKTVTGVDVETSYGNLPISLGDSIDAALYRLVQEGITNAFKHGGARRVRISLWRGARDIEILVWDDGRGSDAAQEGLGLKGMRERFAAIGGQVGTRNVADGFELYATIPIKQMDGNDDEEETDTDSR
jgi:signal transduction histidine kinase